MKSTTFSPQLTCMWRPFGALNSWGLLQSAIFELDCGKKLPLYCWSGNILLRSALEEGITKTSMDCLRASTICVICRIPSTCICMPPITTSAVMESTSSLKPMRSCCETCMICSTVGSDSTSTCFLLKGTFSRESCPRESGGWGARAGRKRWRAAKRLECFLNLPYSTTCTPQGRSVGSSFLEPMQHSPIFSFSLPVLSSISNQSCSSQSGLPLPYFSGYSFSKALTLLASRRLMVPAMQYRVPFSLTWAMGTTPATLNLSASCAMRDRYMFLNSRPILQSLLFHSICGASSRPVSLATAAGSGARERAENWARRSQLSSLSILAAKDKLIIMTAMYLRPFKNQSGTLLQVLLKCLQPLLLYLLCGAQAVSQEEVGLVEVEILEEKLDAFSAYHLFEMEQKLYVSVLFEWVSGCFDIVSHCLQGLPLQSKSGVGVIAAISFLLHRWNLNLLDFYPHNRLLEVEAVCLHPTSQESGKFRFFLWSARWCQVEVVLVAFPLKNQAVSVECLKLVADHEALEVWLLSLHQITNKLRCSRMVIPWGIGSPYYAPIHSL